MNYYHIKKLSITSHIKNIAIIFIICFFVSALFWQLFSLYLSAENKRNNKHNTVLIPQSEVVANNNNSLVYKLIAQEKKWQIAEAEKQAKYNFDWFFQEALKIDTPKPTTQEVKAYFQQISSLMNKHFIYEANTSLTEGLAQQKIDCDLRSYIFYDVTQKIGLDTSIVYSPRHAFVVWKSPSDQLDVAWETTARGKGKAVNLTNSLYETAHDGITYRPTTEKEVIYLYEAFTAARALEEGKTQLDTVRNKAMEMAKSNPDWHFLQAQKAYYLYNEKDDKTDLKETAEKLLELQPANSTANYILMEHFNNKGDKNKVREFFNSIKTEDKDFESRMIYADAQPSWLKRLALTTDAYLYRSFWNITNYEELKETPYLHRVFLGFLLFMWGLMTYAYLTPSKSEKEKIVLHGAIISPNV